jgi:hypothetical protein
VKPFASRIKQKELALVRKRTVNRSLRNWRCQKRSSCDAYSATV